jgi:hypothetical protein
MKNMSKKIVPFIILAIVGTVSFLIITNIIGQQTKHRVELYFFYQLITLALAVLMIFGVSFLKKRKLSFFKIGELNAGASPVKLLGIKKTDTWKSVGFIFTIIITITTGVVLYLTYKDQLQYVPLATWFYAFFLSIPLSMSNAFSEEIVTRWSIVEGMTDNEVDYYAPWISAAIFGGVHFFGIPGGFTGSLMAGFLAYFLAKSMQDTHGIGWAFFIHFCQDVLIFTTTLALFL